MKKVDPLVRKWKIVFAMEDIPTELHYEYALSLENAAKKLIKVYRETGHCLPNIWLDVKRSFLEKYNIKL